LLGQVRAAFGALVELVIDLLGRDQVLLRTIAGAFAFAADLAAATAFLFALLVAVLLAAALLPFSLLTRGLVDGLIGLVLLQFGQLGFFRREFVGQSNEVRGHLADSRLGRRPQV
jgi:hypothetical protein